MNNVYEEQKELINRWKEMYYEKKEENEILKNNISSVIEDLVKTKIINNRFKNKNNNEFINIDIDHIDYLIMTLQSKEK